MWSSETTLINEEFPKIYKIRTTLKINIKMNATKLKITLIALITFLSFSCSSDSSSSSEETTTGGTNTTTNTWVKLTARTSSDQVKPNYIIMMFDQPVTTTAALPPIKKQITTDTNGLAYFDLNTIVTTSTPTTYYFEAFVKNVDNYIMKSVSNPSYTLVKGQMITSSIIVN